MLFLGCWTLFHKNAGENKADGYVDLRVCFGVFFCHDTKEYTSACARVYVRKEKYVQYVFCSWAVISGLCLLFYLDTHPIKCCLRCLPTHRTTQNQTFNARDLPTSFQHSITGTHRPICLVIGKIMSLRLAGSGLPVLWLLFSYSRLRSEHYCWQKGGWDKRRQNGFVQWHHSLLHGLIKRLFVCMLVT